MVAPSHDQILREEMVRSTLLTRDIRDPAVLTAMRKVPRHLFVPHCDLTQAYKDWPLAIGCSQTISQPYIVAYMAQAAQLHKENSKVLEIGTGSGYGAAVLSELAAKVFTIEYQAHLASSARQKLQELGYTNVTVRHGDGTHGWPEEQPFDAIVVTAAPPRIPYGLLEQLKLHGHMVIPVGDGDAQEMLVFTRTTEGIRQNVSFPVRFVPMLGDIQTSQESHFSRGLEPQDARTGQK